MVIVRPLSALDAVRRIEQFELRVCDREPAHEEAADRHRRDGLLVRVGFKRRGAEGKVAARHEQHFDAD